VEALTEERGDGGILFPNPVMGGAVRSPVWTRGLGEENGPWRKVEGEEWGAGKGKQRGAHSDFMQSRESGEMGAQSRTRHVEDRKEGGVQVLMATVAYGRQMWMLS
jgi:hypothetical protein